MQPDTIAGFGFCTIGDRPDLEGLDRALGRIEDVGATHAELSLYAAHLIAGGRVVPSMRRRLEQICARRKLGYTVHGALSVNFMDEANLELHEAVCTAMLELCRAVGAAVMVQHPGLIAAPAAEALERLHALERDALRRMGDVAARHGVRLAVETLFVEMADRYTADPIRLARELHEIDHPHVMGTLDLSHTAIMSTWRGLELTAAVAAMAPVTGHFHLHDSFGRPTTVDDFYTLQEQHAFGMGDLHLPMGWGSLAFEELLVGRPYLPGSILICELPDHFWAELAPCADALRHLQARLNGK